MKLNGQLFQQKIWEPVIIARSRWKAGNKPTTTRTVIKEMDHFHKEDESMVKQTQVHRITKLANQRSSEPDNIQQNFGKCKWQT